MLLKSFDNYHEERLKRKQEYLDKLKKEQEEIQRKIETAKNNAFDEAVKKVSSEMTSQKEKEFQDIYGYNKKQIEDIYKKIDDEITIQAEHYAKIFAEVIGYFLPEWAKAHGLGELVDCLKTLLKSCSDRTIMICANKNMIEYLEHNLDIGNKRIALTENQSLGEGMIEIKFEGGGAEINFNSIKEELVKEIENITSKKIDSLNESEILFKE